MTLEKARELLGTQVSFGGGYNRQGARLILADVAREHGQDAVDADGNIVGTGDHVLFGAEQAHEAKLYSI